MTQTRTHDAANELVGITGGMGGTWISPVYDAAANMTQAPKPGAETTRIWLKYDAWNRLAEVDADSGGSPGAALGTYRYDGLNRRISKTAGTDTLDYYYNENWQVLEVRKNGSSNPLEQWVWDQRYIDAPVLRWHDSNTDGTVDDTLYACNDANMNVTALVDASSGSVVERYAYDPYGRVRVMDGSWGSRSTSNYDWQVLYAGYQHDSESGLQYARNRYSDDATGDWTTRDSDGYANSFDLYSYVRERPTGNLDPYGSDIFAPAPDGPVVQASVRALKRGNCGNVYFAVSWVFKVAPKQDGWVIQEVTIHRDTKWTDGRVNQLPNNANGDWHYWEAWPVYKGSREAGGRMGMYLDLHPGKNEYNVTIRGTDQFSATSMPQCTKGHESWFGWVDFYPGPLPPGNWVRNNSKTKAGVLPATTSEPGFGHPGTGGGTHLLEVSWDCGSGVKPTRVVDHTP